MRILIVSDAWTPQVNGVVVTLRNTVACLGASGHVADVIGPDRFFGVPCPTYPEIRLAMVPARKLGRLADAFDADAVHIATEGPLGMAARRYCLRKRLAFTTAFHTRLPEYVHVRTGLPLLWTYAWMRRFHAPSQAVMVPTDALHAELAARGFPNLARWSRGVDTSLFRPGPRLDRGWNAPVFMYVGRVAVEKNLPAFLSLDLPGTKVVVGDGPERATLAQRFPDAVFTGAMFGEDLAAHYRSADVFVFPSRTDTFGLVLLEAMASGTPVAAYPVTGPIDVVAQQRSGCLDVDLRTAALAARHLDRHEVRRYAERFSWQRATDQFVSHLHPDHASA